MNQFTSPLLGDMTTEHFLKQYWQKKPCILRQVIHPKQMPALSIDELAGYALEEEVESRLILGKLGEASSTPKAGDNVDILYGPFTQEKLASLPEQDWTLLIQSVDIWNEDYRQLLGWVNFLPAWRLDDIMLSIAATGGGVGPHRDQYDVFLIQIEGERQWRVSPPNAEKDIPFAAEILQVEPFDGEINETVAAGDVLYIPPGWRHWGIANNLSVTCSIGFRAPSTGDLLTSLSEKLLLSESSRFSDPWRKHSLMNNITEADLNEVRNNLLQLTNNHQLLAQALGEQVTQPKFPADDFEAVSIKNKTLRLQPATRMSYFIQQQKIFIYVNGETLDMQLPSNYSALLERLCKNHNIELNDPLFALLDNVIVDDFLNQLVLIGAIKYEIIEMENIDASKPQF